MLKRLVSGFIATLVNMVKERRFLKKNHGSETGLFI
jgi:hypothetical protein